MLEGIVKGANAYAPVDAGARTQKGIRSGFRGTRIEPAELRSLPLFAEMAAENLNGFADLAFQRCLEPRSRFIEENEQCQTLYVVLEGTVEVFSGSDEQETVLDVGQAGAILLLASVMTASAYAAGVRTISRARIVAVPAAAIRDLFERDRAFARAVVVELSRASCSMMAELIRLKTRTSLGRLIDWLLEIDADTGATGHFELPFSKRTLASRLGMTPECLSRNFRSLAGHGISLRRRQVTIANSFIRTEHQRISTCSFG
jgi:CRP/FNR family transcriptional activator FtrB